MIDRAAVTAALRSRYGVRLRDRWLGSCIEHLEAELSQLGHTGGPLHVEAQVRLVYEQLLHSEISDSCAPVLTATPAVLPQDGGTRDVFLQVQEIVDVGVSRFAMWEALREKEDFEQRGIRPSYLPPPADDEGVFTAAAGTQQTQTAQADGGDEAEMDERQPKVPRAMLKLVLTDGATLLPAIEVDRVAQLDVELPVGTKVLVARAEAQVLQPTATLCLRPGVIKVLGGRPRQYEQLTQKARLQAALDALRQQRR